MIISQPANASSILPYVNVQIQGCADIKVGFDFVSEQPVSGKRRYCNKVLVHECYSVIEPSPITLDHVEFIATDDPCYALFNIFKSSNAIEEIDPTIDIQFNEEGKAVGVIVNFAKIELCCLPLIMTYRMYGYVDESNRVLLANGNLYVSPCNCAEVDSIPGSAAGIVWTDVNW